MRPSSFLTLGMAVALAAALASPASAMIFEDDLDDNSAGWTFESLTGNFSLAGSDVVYGYDYSADGIPEAPNSDPGDPATSGARIRTNTTGLPTDQAALWLEDTDFSGQYTVQVDMWLNWPPDPEAVGTTIHGGLYVGSALPGDLNTNAPVQSGAGYIASSDGDCGNCDHILLKNEFEMDTYSDQYSVRDFGFGNQPGFDNTDVNTNAAEGDLIDIPALLPSLDIDTVTNNQQNSGGTQQPAGAVGFRWVTITAEVDPTDPGLGPAPGQTPSGEIGTTTFSITNDLGETIEIGKVDNSRPDILDDDGVNGPCNGGEDICVNLNNPLDGDVPVDMEGRISLFLIDFFAGSGSNIDLSYALFDNVKVFETDSGGLLGDADGDGDVDGDDLIAVQTNFGSVTPPPGDADFDGDVDGDDLIAVQTNFGNVAPATSVPEPTSVVLLAGLAGIGLAARRR